MPESRTFNSSIPLASRDDEDEWFSAGLELSNAASLIEVEQRMERWVAHLCQPDGWRLECNVHIDDAPYFDIECGKRARYAIDVPISIGKHICGSISLYYSDDAPEHLLERLSLLGHIAVQSVNRLYKEIQSLAHAIELSLVRSLSRGGATGVTEPHLDTLADELLQRLDVSVLQIGIHQPGTGNLVCGISARRDGLQIGVEYEHISRMNALSMSEPATAGYLLANGLTVEKLAEMTSLNELSALQSLLFVPIKTETDLLGGVVVGETRHWTRQPIRARTVEICRFLADSIAASIAQSRYLGRLIERDQFTQDLINSLDDGVVTTRNGVIVSWNQAAHQLFGYHGSEMIGRPFAEVFPTAPDELHAASQAVAALETVKRTVEWRMKTVGGQGMLLQCTIARLRDSAIRSPVILYVFRDVGQERELEYLKDELLSSISHELRTPLNGIVGFSQLLIERPHLPEAVQRESLLSLRSSVERLTRMSDDFIDVARARRHRLPLSTELADLREIVQSMWPELKQHYDDHRLSTRMQRHLPRVRVDVMRVKQILDNLVGNAAKYSAPGTRIAVRAAERDGMVMLTVEDEGYGIDPVAQERIFEPFYRADNVRAQRASGVGLGLSIVKSLVEAHEGRIAIRSAVGRGTTISITFPAAQDHEDEYVSNAR